MDFLDLLRSQFPVENKDGHLPPWCHAVCLGPTPVIHLVSPQEIEQRENRRINAWRKNDWHRYHRP